MFHKDKMGEPIFSILTLTNMWFSMGTLVICKYNLHFQHMHMHILQATLTMCVIVFSRKNFVFLQIGYKTLSYELQEQTVEFGIESLFGIIVFTYCLLLINIQLVLRL